MFVRTDIALPAINTAGTDPARTIRVLTVDDSALIRLTLNRYLGRCPDIEVVGQAEDGRQFLDMLPTVDPDVVVLDIEMPEMNGLEALRRLMKARPLPVIILSNLSWAGAEVTVQALELGAVDFVLKPQSGVTMAQTVKVLVKKIRDVASARAIPVPGSHDQYGQDCKTEYEAPEISCPNITPLRSTDRVIAVASSTGGPGALTDFLRSLPCNLPLGGVIVQHMPAGFTSILSQRLDRVTQYHVREAVDGDRIQRGQFLVAPGGFHLCFDWDGKARLTDEPPVNGVRPSADITLQSLADLYGSRVVGVVLTGMGKDGHAGSKHIHSKGGMVLAQSEDSCVVYGMPRLVAESGLASQVANPVQLGTFVGQNAQ